MNWTEKAIAQIGLALSFGAIDLERGFRVMIYLNQRRARQPLFMSAVCNPEKW